MDSHRLVTMLSIACGADLSKWVRDFAGYCL